MAIGKKKAVIIFDDMTRPTRTFDIAPVILDELHAAGLKEDDITFVCALGTHGALTMADFRKKLGSKIIEKYRVFNHNIYENCVNVGKTKHGTPVLFNREVMAADLKIGISLVAAHVSAGFSGGGKLLLPGIAHIDSICHFHSNVATMGMNTTGMGCHSGNILREEINEAAAMAKVDFFVNMVVNGRGETTNIFAGDLYLAHNQAVIKAKQTYLTVKRPINKDLVIANVFSKPNENLIAFFLGATSLKESGGTVVVIANSPEGQVPHYLFGRFGTGFGGRLYPNSSIPLNTKLIILTSYPDRTSLDWFTNPETGYMARSWPEVLDLLGHEYGSGTKVAILPNAAMQYFTH